MPLMVTVMVSVSVAPSSSVAVTTFSTVILSPTARKSRSRPEAFSVQSAVLSPLSLTAIAAANAFCSAVVHDEDEVTLLLAVTVELVWAVMVRLVSVSSAKAIEPPPFRFCEDASAASSMLGSTAAVLIVGASLSAAPFMVTVTFCVTLSVPSLTVIVQVSV